MTEAVDNAVGGQGDGEAGIASSLVSFFIHHFSNGSISSAASKKMKSVATDCQK